jgi:hypothetical protein
MKMAVFWAVAPCGLVEVAVIIHRLIMKAAGTSVTSVNFFQTARRNSPEDNSLQYV